MAKVGDEVGRSRQEKVAMVKVGDEVSRSKQDTKTGYNGKSRQRW